MKICPKCQKTYTDENLNFCLDDGSVLNQSGAGMMPDTVLLNQPRATMAPPMQMPTTQQQQQGWNTAPQQQYATPPKKSSKTWLWVLLALGAVILLCGGGGIAGLIYLGSLADNKNVSSNFNTNTSNTRSGPFSGNKSTTPSNTSTSPTSTRTHSEKIDLNKWVKTGNPYGTTEFSNDELIVASSGKRNYFVLTGTENDVTEKADTLVTVRNFENKPSDLGYGLVFHSNPKPLQQGYAFIIDSQKQKYKVVRHVPGDEKIINSWTKSDLIKDGSQENRLEVRDLNDKIELYINGTMVTTIKNAFGYSGGVVGLYSGDGVKIAFKDLEIRK